jgi:ubiquinone biosynthesis protein
VESVLIDNLGVNWRAHFLEFNETPIAAASIAQVYEAKLKNAEGNGSEVVVKVQRPNIKKLMNEDMDILFFVAGLVEKYLPESRVFEPSKIVNEFSKNIELETNFVIEGNNLRRFLKNFSGDPQIKIPEYYPDLSNEHVLVMEKIKGPSFSQLVRTNGSEEQLKKVFRNTLRSYLTMVFKYGFFHGDLHSGNLFVLEGGAVGIIDFGVVGRLNRRTKMVLASMLVALADEDYDRLAFEYLDLAVAKGPVEIENFSRDLRDLISPFYGLSVKHMNTGKLLLESAVLASKHNLVLPSELIMFFKSIVVMEGVGRSVSEHFDFLNESLELAKEVVNSELMVENKGKELKDWGIELSNLLSVLPRQMRQVFRRINDPRHAFKVDVVNASGLDESLSNASNRIFWGFVAGSLILGIAVISTWSSDIRYFGLPILAWLASALLTVILVRR